MHCTCRESWKALAAGKAPPDATGAAGGQHVHLQFCNMIVNDSTYLLGEALEKLPQVGTHSIQWFTCTLNPMLARVRDRHP